MSEKAILEEEYENTAVPLHARKSLLSVSLVWVGFPMIFTGTVTGATIVTGLGFGKGMLSILLGNLILFCYVGLLGILSAKKGYSFGLQSAITFGKKGSMIVSGFLSTLVIGWFAVQTGLTGHNMNLAFGSNLYLMTFIAGILYVAVTLIGVKSLTYIGAVSVPLFLILGCWAVIDATSHSGWSSIVHFSGNSTLSIGVAVTMVVALFADSGTMAGDFNRWSKNKKDSLISSSMAFPIANMIAMIFGGLIVAAASKNADFFQYIASKGGVVSIISIILLFLNLGSVCSHCLYNASVGWSNLLNKKMRSTALVLGVIGTIVAISGAWNHFIQWLSLLGIVVPPIGAVIIMDQFFLRKNADISSSFRLNAFIGWGVGTLLGFLTEFYAPNLSTAFVSLITGGLAYGILSIIMSKSNGLKESQNLNEKAQ
ncbi:purine-cytosine permease family protein [Terrilactibacillus laevilacticus]|uniref:purine-cytosine permease family protein n=1 Tax=Terrilactibacillus laevilacticus TaxID=1380157 RepID=UPI00114679BB|nr:cytosine permease [Terrilactibacillus laevilacticus]